MIVFEGKSVQITWRPNLPKNKEDYLWLYADPSGWMESDTFYKWLEEWEKTTRTFQEGIENELEPRLLIYDGHLAHVWYGTIELPKVQNVTIIKLPPHTTDLLQPLDVSVFKALKGYWSDILFKRMKTTRNRLTKAEFSSYLCDPEVWAKSLSEDNIKNGFRGCGIFPPDRTKYPVKRFNVNLKARYDKWLEEGKPNISAEEIDTMLNEARTQDTSVEKAVTTTNQDQGIPSTSKPKEAVINDQKGKIISFFVPDDNPSQMIPVPEQISLNVTPSSSCSSFKEVALKKIDELQTPEASKPTQKRKKVNPFGTLVTSDEQFDEVMQEEQKERKKVEKANENIKQKSDTKAKQAEKRNKKHERESISFEVEDDENIYEGESEEETDDLQPGHEEKLIFPPSNESDAYEFLTTVWDQLNPPVTEETLQGKFFAVVFYDIKRKPHLYVGRILKLFLTDADGLAKEFSVECLKRGATSTSTVLEEVPNI